MAERDEASARERADRHGYDVKRYSGSPPGDANQDRFTLRNRETGEDSHVDRLEQLHGHLDQLEADGQQDD